MKKRVTGDEERGRRSYTMSRVYPISVRLAPGKDSFESFGITKGKY